MKNRGFLIGLVIFALSATAAYVIGVSKLEEKSAITRTSTLAMCIEEAMRNHRKRNEVYPAGTTLAELAGLAEGEELSAGEAKKLLKRYSAEQTAEQRMALAKALRGKRELAQDHLHILPFILEDGQLVDIWGHPFLIGVDKDGRPFALSPGPNGKFHDKDDVDSKEAKKTVKLLEED